MRPSPPADGWRLSDPPPDEGAAPPLAHAQAAPSGDGASRPADWRLAEPPPDEGAEPALAAALSAGGDGAAPEWRLPAPPPDEGAEPPVAPTSRAQSADAAPTTAPPAQAAVPLDNQEIYRIVRAVAEGHSGADRYGAVRTDRPADGLAFGLALFTQRSGLLGAVLQAMHRRDPVRFTEVFGPASADLLAVTTAATPEARMRPVEGQPLTAGPWPARFAEAGREEAFQAAQNEVAIERQFRPAADAAMRAGLASDRALAVAYEAAVTLGPDAATDWLAGAASAPGPTADRLRALADGAPPALAPRLRALLVSDAFDGTVFTP